jgi:ATP-grasp domain, R2K clade family 3
MDSMMLLVPSNVLRPRRPDEHFAPEAEAARDAGLTVAFVDHDALASGDAADHAVARVPEGHRSAVYRGWMLRSEEYAAFEQALARRGVTLRTDAGQYRRGHELPGWYEALSGHTPRSTWTATTSRAAFDDARALLGPGPAVLRDYTKSMKHHWDEAVFIPDLADEEAAWSVACRFLQLRGDDLVGGLVLRRFERFVSAEVRSWWIDGAHRLTSSHPDTPNDPPPQGGSDAGTALDRAIAALRPLVAGLGLPFVTVDLARRDDGTWRVIELGDGQVSDRPVTLPTAALITALASPQEP